MIGYEIQDGSLKKLGNNSVSFLVRFYDEKDNASDWERYEISSYDKDFIYASLERTTKSRVKSEEQVLPILDVDIKKSIDK